MDDPCLVERARYREVMLRHRSWKLAVVQAVVTLGLLVGLPSAGAATSDWPTYHHDDLRTADATIPGTLTSLTPTWQWNVPQAAQDQDLYASPLIADGLVVVTSESNWVYAAPQRSQRLESAATSRRWLTLRSGSPQLR